MRLSRRHGAVRLRFDPAEAALLRSLVDDFVAGLHDATSADDPVQRRLFPAAYADDEAAAEFRELTESGLRDERGRRALACREQLGTGELTLEPDDGERWIQVLNDLRLVLGTRLEVTEDDDQQIDPDDPDAAARGVYFWLGYVQESLLRAIAR